MMRVGDAGLAFHEEVLCCVEDPVGGPLPAGFLRRSGAKACCPCMFPERPRLLNIHAAIRPRSTDDLASLRAGRPDQPRTAQKKPPAVSTGVFSVLQPACP